MNKPLSDATSKVSASAFERTAFDISSYRRDGIQIIKDFFEPGMKARFKALGERVVAGVESGEINRSCQFATGIDLSAEACPSDSAALTTLAEELFGKDVGQLNMRLVMKDANYKISIEAHQDWPYFGGNTNKLNVFIPITHCGADNGMVEYYVGSHIMGPVVRGDIDVTRYPQFEGVIPELEIGDVLLADFLTWHSSIESLTGEPRIMIQLVLQPASDLSTLCRFDGSPVESALQVLVRRTTPMRTSRPDIGIVNIKEAIAISAIDEAARMARGLCFDSPMNVEARLILADIIKRGHKGDGLLNGLTRNDHFSDLLDTAEQGLLQLAREVDKALGRPSCLTVELTGDMNVQLDGAKEALCISEQYLNESRNELTQSAGELWQARKDLEAARAENADLALRVSELSAELAPGQQRSAIMEASASWKVTGLLRRVASAIKRR